MFKKIIQFVRTWIIKTKEDVHIIQTYKQSLDAEYRKIQMKTSELTKGAQDQIETAWHKMFGGK